MKNKSRRASSTGKKQRNKTRKNRKEKGGTREQFINGQRYLVHDWRDKAKEFFGKKKSPERLQYLLYKDILWKLVYIYYKEKGVMPLVWGEEEMKVVRESNDPVYLNYKNFLDKIKPEYVEYMNTILMHKIHGQKKGYDYFCDTFAQIPKNNEYINERTYRENRLKCKLRWTDKDYKELIEFMRKEQYIPKYILEHLDNKDRNTVCNKVGAPSNTIEFNNCMNGKHFYFV